MVTKTFAGQYPRSEEGWIHFPRDVEYRRGLFPNPKHPKGVQKGPLGEDLDVFQHPAKMQLHLVRELIEYLTDPGDQVLDVFGGTGGTALAATMGRPTTLLEIEQEFAAIIKASMELLIPNGTTVLLPNGAIRWPLSAEDMDAGLRPITLFIGDNRQLLQEACPADTYTTVITSPPYSNALNNTGRLEATMRSVYQGNGLNMGKLNPFNWEQEMVKVWKGVYRVLKPGGTVAIVNKDIMKSGGREPLTQVLVKRANECGLRYREWHRWATPGTNRTRAMLAKGATAVLDEDVVICVKE